MRKILFLKKFILISTCLASFLLIGERKIVDQIYYFINDDIITQLDFEEQKDLFLKSRTPLPPGENNVNVFVMSNLIFNNLVFDFLGRQGKLIDDNSVENEIKKIMNRQGISSLEVFKGYLSQNNINYATYFDNLKKQINQRNFFSESVSQVVASSEEVNNYYLKNKNKYRIQNPIFDLSAIKISFSDSVGFSARRKFQRELSAIRDEIITEKIPFDEALTKFNDFNKSIIGQELGWVEVESLNLPANIQRTLVDLNIGDVSPVLTTSDGLNIFLVNGKKSSGLLPFNLAQKRAERDLTNLKSQETITKRRIELFQNAHLKSNNALFKTLAETIDDKS